MFALTPIAIVLIAAFVTTESYSPPSSDCEERISYCTTALQQNPFISGQSTNVQTVFDDIDSICTDIRSAEQCLTPTYRSICPSQIADQISVSFDVSSYICSARGKELLNQFKQSPCYNDPLKIYKVEGLLEICTAQILSNPPSGHGIEVQCQAAANILDCTVQGTADSCGQAAATLTNEIANRLLPIFTNNQCPIESARALVKKGFGFIKRQWQY